MDVSEILQLMEGMNKWRVGSLEVGDVRLTSLPDARQPLQSAASGLVPPSPDKMIPQVTAQDALKATMAAQESARKLADERLGALQARTANARRKAAGGIGPRTGGHVAEIYKEAKKSARTKPTS